MNFSDALNDWLEQKDEGDEASFRRGYVHGIAFAIDAVASGATVAELNEWLARCQQWRESLSLCDGTEWIPPRFKEARNGTRASP